MHHQFIQTHTEYCNCQLKESHYCKELEQLLNYYIHTHTHTKIESFTVKSEQSYIIRNVLNESSQPPHGYTLHTRYIYTQISTRPRWGPFLLRFPLNILYAVKSFLDKDHVHPQRGPHEANHVNVLRGRLGDQFGSRHHLCIKPVGPSFQGPSFRGPSFRDPLDPTLPKRSQEIPLREGPPYTHHLRS